MENEVKVEEVNIEGEVMDLSNFGDIEELVEELNKGGMYFKPESNKSYKIKLSVPTTKKVKTNFVSDTTGEPIYKTELGIISTDAEGNKFEGLWQIGTSIFRPMINIIKDNKDTPVLDLVFTYSKTGSGVDTKHSIVKDF